MTSRTQAPPTQDDRSPLLAVTGFLMLAILVVNANPYFGVQELWPWELMELTFASSFVQYEIVLWAFAGLLAMALAFTNARQMRATLLTGLALIFVAQMSRSDSGLRVARFAVSESLAVIGLGAGLLMMLEGRARGAGRLICGVGALAFLWSFFVGFSGQTWTPRYAHYLHGLESIFGSGEVVEALPGGPWVTMFPQLLLLLGAVMALLASCGLVARKYVLTTLLVLLVGLVMPVVARLVLVMVGADAEIRSVAGALYWGFISDGILLCLLGALAISQLPEGEPA